MLQRERLTIEEEEEEEEQYNHHHPRKTIRRMSAATEASLDDIVHSYGGITSDKNDWGQYTKSCD